MDDLVISKWSGVPQSLRAARGYNKNLGAAMERGVHKMTEFLKVESVKVTPVKTGELRASASTQYTGRLKNCRGRVKFTARYAIYVHEDLDKYHAPGTYAKFLSRTSFEKRGQMNAIFWGEVNKVRL